jgi:hypothetical protein
VIDGVPQPTLMRFVVHIAPHFVELRAQLVLLLTGIRPAYLHLDLFRMQICQHRLIDLLERRFFFLSSLITVVGLTCNTRAVSRMPLACIAMSTI